MLLVASAILLRWLKLSPMGADILPGFSPWMALAFTGTLLYSRSLQFWMIPAAILLVDQFSFGGDLQSLKAAAPTYACLIAAALWATSMRGKLGILGTLGGVVTCSLGFYLVSNTFAWLGNPVYAKSLTGWWQALTVGVPGFPPSWMFFRNALMSDLAFSLILVLGHNVEARQRGLVRLPLLRATAA
jgi:hypothetical protein